MIDQRSPPMVYMLLNSTASYFIDDLQTQLPFDLYSYYSKNQIVTGYMMLIISLICIYTCAYLCYMPHATKRVNFVKRKITTFSQADNLADVAGSSNGDLSPEDLDKLFGSEAKFIDLETETLKQSLRDALHDQTISDATRREIQEEIDALEAEEVTTGVRPSFVLRMSARLYCLLESTLRIITDRPGQAYTYVVENACETIRKKRSDVIPAFFIGALTTFFVDIIGFYVLSWVYIPVTIIFRKFMGYSFRFPCAVPGFIPVVHIINSMLAFRNPFTVWFHEGVTHAAEYLDFMEKLSDLIPFLKRFNLSTNTVGLSYFIYNNFDVLKSHAGYYIAFIADIASQECPLNKKQICAKLAQVHFYNKSQGYDILKILFRYTGEYLRVPIQQLNSSQGPVNDMLAYDRLIKVMITNFDTLSTTLHRRYITDFLGEEVTQRAIKEMDPSLAAHDYNITNWLSMDTVDISCNKELFILAKADQRLVASYSKKLMDESDDPCVKKFLTNYNKNVAKFEKMMTGLSRNFCEGRQRPTSFALIGPSSVGKTSTLMMFIASAILNKRLHRTNHVFSVSENDDYASGYGKQPVYLHDDVGAFKIAKNDIDRMPYSDLLEVDNDTDMSLNMANIEDKGMKIESPINVYTSNVYPMFEQASKPEAFTNRLFILDIVIHPAMALTDNNNEYELSGDGNYKIDPEKIEAFIDNLDPNLTERERAIEVLKNYVIKTSGRFKKEIPEGIDIEAFIIDSMIQDFEAKKAYWDKQKVYDNEETLSNGKTVAATVAEHTDPTQFELDIENDNFKDKLWSYISPSLKRIKLNIKTLKAIIFAVAMILILYTVWKRYKEACDCDENSSIQDLESCGCQYALGALKHSAQSDYNKDEIRTAARRMPKSSRAHRTVNPQGPIMSVFNADQQLVNEFPIEDNTDKLLLETGTQCIDEFRAAVTFSSMALIFYYKKTEKSVMNGFLTGNTLIMCKHAFLDFGKKFTFCQVSKDVTFYHIANPEYIEVASDLVSIKLNVNRKFKDCSKLLAEEKDMQYLSQCKPAYLHVKYKNGLFFCTYNYVGQCELDVMVRYYTTAGTQYRSHNAIRVAGTNFKGYCGAILISTSGVLANKVVSMHVAGDGYSQSYSLAIPREAVLEAQGPEPEEQPFYKGPGPKVFCSTKSRMSKSIFHWRTHQFYERETLPVALNARCLDNKKALWKNLEGFNFNKDAMTLVYDDLNMQTSSFKTYTLLEACIGNNELKPIRRDTTMGLPFVGDLDKNHPYYPYVNKAKMSKNYYIPVIRNNTICYPPGWSSLQAMVNIRLEEYRKGRIQLEFVMAPKGDEALPKAKIESNTTRPVYYCSFIDNIIIRMYFGDFLSDCVTHRVTNEMAIGVNPYSYDWKLMINKLKTDPTYVYIDQDMKSQESNAYHPEVNDLINKVILSGFSDELELRKNILDSLSRPSVLWAGNWFEGMDLNPSGHGLTTAKNSINTRFWKRYVYYCLQYEKNENYHHRYGDNCDLVTLGDDSIEGVRKDIAEDFYDLQKAKQLYEDFGIVITAAVKDQPLQYTENLEEKQFIKRGFEVDEDGLPIPALDFTSLLRTCFWIAKGDKVSISISSMESVLIEAAYYGRETYDHFISEIIRPTLQYYNLKHKFLTYDAQLLASKKNYGSIIDEDVLGEAYELRISGSGKTENSA